LVAESASMFIVVRKLGLNDNSEDFPVFIDVQDRPFGSVLLF
jgi:hypothetical protein